MARPFSERHGLKSVTKAIQFESIDAELRTRIWNILTSLYWGPVSQLERLLGSYNLSDNRELHEFCINLWRDYFVWNLDELPNHWSEVLTKIRRYYFSCAWNEVYDFIVFVARHHPDRVLSKRFRSECNQALVSESAGYRFVGSKVTPITSEVEIIAIEDALASPVQSVSLHLQRALELLTDRKSPDYRNSIKESISAVEALARRVTGDPKATLGQALNPIDSKIGMHGAFKSALSSLYGYTSDEQGIRHSLLEQSSLDSDDAKFMLVTCSGFVNYLVEKCAKAGIKI